MATDLTKEIGKAREAFAFEPEVRKPCLLLDGSDHLRSGKGRVASSADQDKVPPRSADHLIRDSKILMTPSIFFIGDRGRFVFLLIELTAATNFVLTAS
jgi:hypothetical protein